MVNNKVIAITLHRRLSETGLLFEALSRCYGIKDYKVAVHIDECETPLVRAGIQRTAENFMEQYCPDGFIDCEYPPLGVDKAKLAILPLAFQKSDYVIFLEDDTPPAPDTLRYFEACFEMFADDPLFVSATGYNRYLEQDTHERVVASESYAIDRGTGFCPWGWAMTYAAYEKIIGDGSAYCERYGEEANGRFDFYINHYMSENPGSYSVYPVLPRTNHVGGTNAVHTPSREWLMANEFAPYTANDVDLKDVGTSLFYKKWTEDK